MRRLNRWYDALPEPQRFLLAMGLIAPIWAIGSTAGAAAALLAGYALLLAVIRLNR